jgi:DNA modification methylase
MPQPLKRFINQIICGETLRTLRQIPSDSIDCVVTSPPYWALRDYGVEGQLGLETSFQEYIAKLCRVFDEVKRVLKKEGTCWVNLGDTYSTQSSRVRRARLRLRPTHSKELDENYDAPQLQSRLPAKCLVEIPSRFAIEMINRGWILRNEIIWWKPNCTPSSARDRFTVDFEKIFFFVKSRKYYFKQQFEELRGKERLTHRLFNPDTKKKRVYGEGSASAINPKTAEQSRLRMIKRGRNKRCVWRVITRAFRGNHFAVYPPQLIETPIRAGCPPGGIVLDPFMGSGTTALTARKLNRKFIGIELNPYYVRMARRRLRQDAFY